MAVVVEWAPDGNCPPYPIPVHVQDAYADLGYRAGDFPISERVASEVLSLPMYAELTDAQIETVAAAVKEGV